MAGNRFIDLSVALDPGVPSDPPGLQPRVTYISHAEGARSLSRIFPGLKPEDLPAGEGWAVEELAMSTHAGTHLDAPWHFASTMDGGKPALHIDEVPLDWCFRPGVKLDFRDRPDGHVLSASELEAELGRIGYKLAPLDIVLVNTSAGAAYGQADYVDRGCGVGREGTLWLLRQGVRVTGTDAWSWDAPFSVTRRRFAETRDATVIWEGHKAGLEIGYCHLEKLTNLECLPPAGFRVSCFPYKIRGASAGFTRAVAILET